MIKVIWPKDISLRYWANSLVADYPFENLPILHDETQWQKWGAQVAGIGSFLAASVPSPATVNGGNKFKKWDDWAKVVYSIMSDEYNK